jgi:glycosyltransferase involved in cell wall biosynthesis
MRVIYGSRAEALLHYAAMLRVGTFSHNPRRHKWLTVKAMFASLMMLPQVLRKRRSLGRRGRHPWIFFDGWLYGRHSRDPAAAAEYECTTDLLASWDSAGKELRHRLPIEQHIVRIPRVHVGGVRRDAALVYDSGRLHYQLAIPPGTVLSGAVAAPQDAWKPTAVGRFELLQDGRPVWEQELNLGKPAHRQWVPFQAPLRATDDGHTSQITLSFEGRNDLVWGLWGDIHLAREEEEPEHEEWLGVLTGLAVSVVVPTYNRADRVERVIHRLMSQDIPAGRFEVILVDSDSTDDTPRAAARLAGRYANLKTLRCQRSGAAAARNLGLAEARGELIVLVDDDILVGADFLRRLLRARHDHPGRVLLGRIIAPWDGSCDPFQRYLLQVQDVNIYDFPDPGNVPANYFYTACVAIPRAVLGDKRFDEGFRVYGVEDIEFGFRLLADEARMVFLPALRVLHDYRPTYRAYRRKKRKAGYSLGYFLGQHPEHAHRFQFGRRFRRYYHLLRLLRTLGAPLAGVLYLGERLLYQEGPVNRALHWWWYADLRIQLYSGLRRYRRGATSP